MPVEYCGNIENVLHAIQEAHWHNGRVSTRFLSGNDKSVSRLSVYSKKKIFAIFHRDFDRPDKSPVVAAFHLNVGDITTQSAAFFDANRKPEENREGLKVAIKPIPGKNEAHAEIAGRVTDGLSKCLYEHGTQRWEPIWLRMVYQCLRPFRLSHKLGIILAQ